MRGERGRTAEVKGRGEEQEACLAGSRATAAAVSGQCSVPKMSALQIYTNQQTKASL